MVGLACCCPHTLPLWIADQVCNDGHGHYTSTLWILAYAGLACFTLILVLSHLKGEGE